MSDKYTAEELASKLEAKVKQLRESGLTEDDMAYAAGGACMCFGSDCKDDSSDDSDRPASPIM